MYLEMYLGIYLDRYLGMYLDMYLNMYLGTPPSLEVPKFTWKCTRISTRIST